jgi:hypothetical protein
MELRNILKFGFEACQAFQNMAVVLHPVQRFQNLSLIPFHFVFERIKPLVDSDIKRFDALSRAESRTSIERISGVTKSWIS